MNEDLFRREFRTVPDPPETDNLFLWTVGIILLIGVALACWLGSYYIFGHPEKPDSYHILKDVLHKLEPPKRFVLTAAPPGVFLTPQKAFETFGSLTNYELDRKNEELLRDFINNYQNTKNLVPYLTGRYSILSSYELKNTDFIGLGLVSLAQAAENPQVVIEHIYPATPQALPIVEQMLRTGLDIKLEKSLDLSAVIHVARTPDGRLQFTLVPLLYGSYALKQGSGSFSLEPPKELNPAAGLPIVRGQLYEDALKTFAEYTRKHAPAPVSTGGGPGIPVAQSVASTTIIQLDPPAAPPVTKATPTPAKTAPAAPAAPAPAVAIQPTPVPIQPPPAAASPTPAPVAVATSTPKIPLQPFLASAPSPAPTPITGGTWRTYAPGKMPRGRLVSLSEANELADRGTGGERLYLRGNFTVSVSNENRAVLRSSSPLSNALSTVTNGMPPRVIVEYPAGALAPPKNTVFARDELRPFEITSVRREPNGQINIFAREVIAD
ncbi:MAG: hypothetical protein NTZ46_10725 [Verrucomicrobia bacterium]|nr:hypothetical protein [Verrucomicrobiota bacterium]